MNLMDPNELNTETMLDVLEQTSSESVIEKIMETFDINYDIFGCWESSQDETILFI